MDPQQPSSSEGSANGSSKPKRVTVAQWSDTTPGSKENPAPGTTPKPSFADIVKQATKTSSATTEITMPSEGGPLPGALNTEPSVRIKSSTNSLARQRFLSAYRSAQQSTLTFLGLSDDWTATQQDRWMHQRLLLAKRQGKDAKVDEIYEEQKKLMKNRKRDQQKSMKRQISEDPRMHVRAQISVDNRSRDAKSVDSYDGGETFMYGKLSARPEDDRSLGTLDSVTEEQMDAESIGSQSDDDDSEETSDDELQKLSVYAITLSAVSKAATKWKTAASKVSPPESAGGMSMRTVNNASVGVGADQQRQQLHEDEVEGYLPSAQPRRRIKHVKEKKPGICPWLCGLKARVPDNYVESRPYFTYWVTSVHITVLILSLVLYPWAPYGYGLKTMTGEVLTTSLSLEIVEYEEPASFWVGPSQSSLVALGAKFTPCMRVEQRIQEGIEAQKIIEADTGCCIRHDDSGCVQTLSDQCSASLSRYSKWTEESPGPDQRTSGPVCGQDPRTCTAPASVPPNVWPDDITKWPICQAANASSAGMYGNKVSYFKDTSSTCEVIGRPCCVGIHGECHITTREHCDLLHGTFHEEASLCSQVHCLSDVCKMLKFLDPDVPDQIYRLWVSLFIHPGVFAFTLTLFLHLIYLRNLEKFAGTVRVTIIYILSGVVGNLASAIFVPNRPEVGPAGCLAGTIACLFVIFIADFLDDMRTNVKILSGWIIFLVVCFLLGLLPGVDNYANIFGFIMGTLLSIALLPHIGQRTVKTNPDEFNKEASIAFISGDFDEVCPSSPSAAVYSNNTAAAAAASPHPRPSSSSSYPNKSSVSVASFYQQQSSSKRSRLLLVSISLCLALALLIGLLVVFYLVPFQCDWCAYLDCVPFTPDFCAEQQTSFERHKIIT